MSVQVPLPYPSKLASRIVDIVGEEFDVAKFAANFDVLVNAAGSAKHLKELVLQLGVRGRLSLGADGTADRLVADLERARARLAPTGARVGPPAVPVSGDEAPYALPGGWRWIRLRDLGGFLGGGTPAKSNPSYWQGPLPWVSPKDMKRPYIDDAEDHISMAAVEGSAVKLIPAQSILYVVRGMILAHSFPVAIATRKVTINQDMKALVLAMPELSEFVLRSCQAARTRVLSKVERSSHGTCRLDSEAVEMLPIALPPLAEQKRIVAKVDQLMALCDELEARQTKKRAIGTRLTTSALEALTTAEGPTDFAAAWKRVADNFDVLVDHSEKLADLRAVILALAASGRLCSHSGSTASVRPTAEMYEPEFSIPGHWGWQSLGSLCKFIDYRGRTPTKTLNGIRLITAKNVRMGVMKDEPREYIAESDYDGWMTRGFPRYGDVLFTTEAPLGNVAQLLTTEKVALAQRIITLQASPAIVPAFLMTMLMGPQLQRSIAGKATGMTALGIKAAKLKLVPFPVPPIDEQQRIVAKVEHLMKVCDILENRLRRAEDRAGKLVEAIVQELVA